jgi:hypothetical protein
MSLKQVDNLQHVNHISGSPCVNMSTRTDPNYSVIILSDNYRLSCPTALPPRVCAVGWARWVRTTRKHELTNDVCHIKCGTCSRRSQSDALTYMSRQAIGNICIYLSLNAPLHAGLYNMALVSYGVYTCFPFWLADTSRRWLSQSVSRCQVRGVCESEQQNKETAAYTRSNASTVLHQQPWPPYILAAGKSKTAPVLN